MRAKYEFGLCTEQFDKSTQKDRYTYNPIDEDYKITKPTIIALNGNDCIHSEIASGFAALVGNLIKPQGMVDILSITYQSRTMFARAQFGDDEAKEVASKLLLPLVTNNGKKYDDINIACHNMRMVTLFAYCFGNQVKCAIVSELHGMLCDVGYSKDECQMILKQLFCVAFAPMKNKYNDYCSNFFVKSFDDGLFGPSFYIEKFDHDFSPKNIGCGIVEQKDNNINLYTEKLHKPAENGYNSSTDDHKISLILRNYNWNLHSDKATFTADVASQCAAYALASGCANSLQNFNNSEFVPLNLDIITQDCNQIVTSFNNSKQGQELIANNQQKIEDYIKENSEVKFTQVLKELGVKQSDIVSGKSPINKFIKDYKGIIIYGSPYEKIRSTATRCINKSAKKEIVAKDRIISLEIVSKYGIIWGDGNLTNTKSADNNLYTSLYYKLFEGYDMNNAIKFEIQTVNNTNFLVLSDNYGSYSNSYTKVKDLIDDWKSNYTDCSLTIKPTDEQKIVITNICTQFNISKRNVIYTPLVTNTQVK